ncbi:rho guanine nucleotide exchange factor 39 [Tribolium castaneum]|uniref:Uncharacterized protein n=1 Tax=Tribolium castaneum TaxID=7070 RepID=D6WIV7_TRICA|nr:PREDICTED: rho guanine nucleotide exchange factor 39 [Tribolium castaneum]EEZ99641.1 Putative protein tag-52-like Protein [Tribolium castaneum]|eukprot:XP_008197463.1 PREDICTED: rho guanine nucleotide exchange factor 39 [Tribolium castaneum]
MLTPEVKPCYVLLEPVTPKANVDFSAELKKVINERNLLTSKTRKRMTEALEEIECENEETSRRSQKENILREILDSEENYLRQLEVIMEFFIKPVQEKMLLKSRDFDVLFGDFNTIYKVNKELRQELRKNPKNVAGAFSKIAPFFKCYSFYASGFRNSLDILQNCHRDNQKFGKFLEMQETRPEVQSKLSALLIAPIQRVPRYKLLLSSLLKLTNPSDHDYQSLFDSLKKVEDAANHINTIIKEQENMQRLIELQRCLINGEPNVITPGRKLLKEGILFKISKTGHSQKTHVALMNDIIIFCKMKKDEVKVNSLKCCGIFPLSKCKIQTVYDKGAFKVVCQNEEIVLYDGSYSETVQWVEEIESAIETHVNDRKTLRKESTVRRPVKRKDLGEYNEIGLSPGKKLRKRKSPFLEESNVLSPLRVSKRRPIRETNTNLKPPSFFVTLKPREDEDSDNNKPVSNEVFVFGKPHPDQGFSFKMNQWLCGIGTSVKKMLGFK